MQSEQAAQHHLAHADHSGAPHGSVGTYMAGFIASIVLTVIPFWMVMTHAAGRETIVATILALAVVQIIVHLVCFLHMKRGSEQYWNNIALAFAVLIVTILVGGTVWIMNNAQTNMMPDVPDLNHQE